MIVTPISLFSNNYFPNIVTRPVVEWKLVSTNKITLSKKTGTMVGQHACHESQGQPEGHDNVLVTNANVKRDDRPLQWRAKPS